MCSRAMVSAAYSAAIRAARAIVRETDFMSQKLHVNMITQRLETFYGEPQWPGRADPLDNLVLTILSQSTNDNNRDTAFRRLSTRFPTWLEVMNAPIDHIADAIRPAGLGNQKAARIKEILTWISQTYGALDLDFICDLDPEQVKTTFMQLKGIGIKTISVVLMISCGVDIFPVDTHVHRICRRLGLAPDNASAEKTHELMQPLVPTGKSYSLHMNLLKLGRNVCKAQNPRCESCPLADVCQYATGKEPSISGRH